MWNSSESLPVKTENIDLDIWLFWFVLQSSMYFGIQWSKSFFVKYTLTQKPDKTQVPGHHGTSKFYSKTYYVLQRFYYRVSQKEVQSLFNISHICFVMHKNTCELIIES